MLRAEGEVTGQSEIKDPWVNASPVLAFDTSAGWMRPLSRWYRLGTPADPDRIQPLEVEARGYLAALRQRAKADAISTLLDI
jgi:hypothetical protein